MLGKHIIFYYLLYLINVESCGCTSLLLKFDQLPESFSRKILGREPRLNLPVWVRTIRVWLWDRTGAPTLNMV